MRCAIYARYSSDLQNPRSIDDQVAACRERALREGWSIGEVYADRAISGSSVINRPALLALMTASEQRQFDVVLCEALDRLSRDLEDIAGIYKRLAYRRIRLTTIADGEVSELHIGLKGTMSVLFLKDLAEKTRRGHIGRLKAGRVPGGKLYGYDVVKGDEKGVRTINQLEAAIVRRIFAEYVAGRSPLEIVGDLNREGVAAPRGGAWGASTINGSTRRQNGIIGSQLYIGNIVYNRQRFVKDPATGRRTPVVNPESEWLVHTVPGLAIVPRELFDAAQARRVMMSNGPLTQRRRPKHLLSGLVRCGCCGGSMIVVRGDTVGCSSHRNKRTCSNRATITLVEIESRVLGALQGHLLAADVVAEAVEAYRIERNRLAAEEGKARRRQAREVGEVDRKIARLIETIESKDHTRDEARSLAARIAELERTRTAILAKVPQHLVDTVLALHPAAAKRYAAKVGEIRAAITKGDEAAQEAIMLVRGLIHAITVKPGTDGELLQLEVIGDLAAMLEHPENSTAMSMVAGPGLEPGTYGL
jgi:site-specific DNA recombinase